MTFLSSPRLHSSQVSHRRYQTLAIFTASKSSRTPDSAMVWSSRSATAHDTLSLFRRRLQSRIAQQSWLDSLEYVRRMMKNWLRLQEKSQTKAILSSSIASSGKSSSHSMLSYESQLAKVSSKSTVRRCLAFRYTHQDWLVIQVMPWSLRMTMIKSFNSLATKVSRTTTWWEVAIQQVRSYLWEWIRKELKLVKLSHLQPLICRLFTR